MDQLLFLVFLSVPVGIVTLTVVRSKLFEPLRNFIEDKNEWLGKLVNCTYCFIHWVSVGAYFLAAPKLLPGADGYIVGNINLLNFALCVSAMMVLGSLAALVMFIVHSAMTTQVDE